MICDTAIFKLSGIFLLQALRFLSGRFFTHRRFLPYAPSMTFLAESAFIKASMGADSFFLKFSGLLSNP